MRKRNLFWWFANEILPRFGETIQVYEDMGNGDRKDRGVYRFSKDIPSRYMRENVSSISFSQDRIVITVTGE